MLKVKLLGVPKDRARMTVLASQLTNMSFVCEVETRGNRSRRRDFSENDPPNCVYIVCWTAHSISQEGSKVQQLAISLKEQNRYVGVILDDVSPPESVSEAQDVRLIGWDSPVAAESLSPLLNLLNELLDRRSTEERGAIARIIPSLKGIAVAVGRIQARLKAIGFVSVITLALGLFGLYSNWIGSQDSICQATGVKRLCQTWGLGHLPSEADEATWRKISSGNLCGPFEQYLESNGPSAP